MPETVDRVDMMAARGRERRILLDVVMLVALLWQGFATGTHLHHARLGAVVSHARAPASSLHRNRPSDPADCPLCWAIAQAGHYVAPDHGPAVDPVVSLQGPAAEARPAPARDRPWSRLRRIRGPPDILLA